MKQWIASISHSQKREQRHPLAGALAEEDLGAGAISTRRFWARVVSSVFGFTGCPEPNAAANTIDEGIPCSTRLRVTIASLGFAASAHAGLIGVKDIKITKAAGSDFNVQLTEVQAFQTGTGTNVALAANGGVAFAPNQYSSNTAPASKAIDGQSANMTFPNMYHSAGLAAGDYLDITLGSATKLSSLTLFGRSDCCSTRDIFDVRFFDTNGVLLHTESNVNATGRTHSASFDLPNTDLPEPASIALLGLSLAGLLGARRQRRAK